MRLRSVTAAYRSIPRDSLPELEALAEAFDPPGLERAPMRELLARVPSEKLGSSS